MPGKHARLSPSAAERWIQCPASIRMEGEVPPEEESSYAREGTLAHSLGELKASLAFGKITKNQYSQHRSDVINDLSEFLGQPWDSSVVVEALAEMDRHTDAYVDLVKERAALYPHTQVMFEERLPTGIPSCWGTSDTVLVSPQHVEIIDFKYGQGVAVEAEGNPQLRLYGLGALEKYGDMLGETEIVRITVHQPRLDHVLTEEITPAKLRGWRDSIIPIAEEALGDDAHFGPSETACRWCPASGRCRAQLEQVFSDDFDAEPDALSPEEMAETYSHLPRIREWLKAFEKAALTMAYSENTPIPGYKVVVSGGQRKISDPEAALNALTTDYGYDFNDVGKTSIRGIGELEKLLGKDKFTELLQPFLTRTQGKPSLVPESDKRQSINPNLEASKAFGEELL